MYLEHVEHHVTIIRILDSIISTDEATVLGYCINMVSHLQLYFDQHAAYNSGCLFYHGYNKAAHECTRYQKKD
jgi:hypothetical protein